MAAAKAQPIDTQEMDKDDEKELKALQKEEAKVAKAVAKEQDELDERVVIRTSYGDPAAKSRYDGYVYYEG